VCREAGDQQVCNPRWATRWVQVGMLMAPNLPIAPPSPQTHSTRTRAATWASSSWETAGTRLARDCLPRCHRRRPAAHGGTLQPGLPPWHARGQGWRRGCLPRRHHRRPAVLYANAHCNLGIARAERGDRRRGCLARRHRRKPGARERARQPWAHSSRARGHCRRCSLVRSHTEDRSLPRGAKGQPPAMQRALRMLKDEQRKI